MTVGPLSGLRVVVTRPRRQARVLVDALEKMGADAVPVPVITIDDPVDEGAALVSGLGRLGRGDWLIVTSPNGAERVGRVIANSPLAQGVLVAAIGPATSRVANEVGLQVALVPTHSIAEGLLDEFPDPPSDGGLVMLARAEIARPTLPEGLAAKGWIVDDVVAYRTLAVDVSATDRAACRDADAVVFTSSSTVTCLVEAVGAEGLPPLVVSIGPATSSTAAALGVRVGVEADVHTIPGLIEALVTHISPSPPSPPFL